jgi:hypothetical protein
MNLDERRAVITKIVECGPGGQRLAHNTRANLEALSDRELDSILRTLGPIKKYVAENGVGRPAFSDRPADIAARRTERYARIAAVSARRSKSGALVATRDGARPAGAGNGFDVAEHGPDCARAYKGGILDRNIMVNDMLGLSLEDIVDAEIRPLMKTWLDAHLAAVVEASVRETIARLAGDEGA